MLASVTLLRPVLLEDVQIFEAQLRIPTRQLSFEGFVRSLNDDRVDRGVLANSTKQLCGNAYNDFGQERPPRFPRQFDQRYGAWARANTSSLCRA